MYDIGEEDLLSSTVAIKDAELGFAMQGTCDAQIGHMGCNCPVVRKRGPVLE